MVDLGSGGKREIADVIQNGFLNIYPLCPQPHDEPSGHRGGGEEGIFQMDEG